MCKITPVFNMFKENGRCHDPVNYRSISLTSIISKIMEKILFKHLFNYMRDHNLLSKFQSGFLKPGDSTGTQILIKEKIYALFFVIFLKPSTKFGMMVYYLN